MSYGFLFIFLYIIIIFFGRLLQSQVKKSAVSKQKQEDAVDAYSFIPDKVKMLENEDVLKKKSDTEEKNEILVDDEVKNFYNKKVIENLQDNPPAINEIEHTTEQKIELKDYLYNHLLVDGIILSEIIALPRALKPYKYKKHSRVAE